MDSSSAVDACESALNLAVAANKTITKHTSSYQNTRAELRNVSRKIADFLLVMNNIKDDNQINSGRSSGPKTITKDIARIAEGSQSVFKQLKKILTEHYGQGVEQESWWKLNGIRKVSRLPSLIAAHTAALSLVLDASHK